MKVIIDINDEELKILKRRAKNNFLNVKSLVDDIIRRSCIRFKKIEPVDKCDDKLISLFSRQKRGKRKSNK